MQIRLASPSRWAMLGIVVTLSFAGQARAQRILTLDSCRSLAKEHSRTLQQKDEEIKAAHAKKQQVMTNFFPQVAARGVYLHMQKELHLIDWDKPLGHLNFLIPERLRHLGTVDLRNLWVGNVTAIQPLFLGGKIISGYKMASLAERLQGELRQTAETEVETKLDETYWQVISLRSKERLLDQLVRLLEQTVKDVDASIDAGVATKADGLSVRTKLSEAEVKRSQVVNGLELSRMLLADLCGLSEDEPFTLAEEGHLQELLLSTQTAPIARDEDTEAAIERRSEIRSLRLVDSIYSKRVNMESASLFPKLYGVASYSTTNPNSFQGQKKEFGGQYYLGLMLEVPISDLFSGTFKRRQAKAEHRVKQLELAEARSKINLQIKQALRTADDARRAYTTALSAVKMAEENMRYAKAGYDEGVIPLLNYTMAQTAWMSAQDSLIDAQIRVLLTESKLKKILAL
ncbi:TolC family protein [Porphyromonas catoniae]|uniref:Outer membrane efflux protein n=1 Tax=Porphyromonas catoniae ATCC 51270 TaxID=887901 RepID=Z4WVQ1_9PORP|nr:TolC family protein [Porphyromonas catoniae]EWC91559.1 outer membrane efflux protein [Porphyromonas catoniae ATCC 51270]